MPIYRKCRLCLTWNGEEERCSSCGEILDPELVREEKDRAIRSVHAQRPKSSLDLIFDGMKNSKWPPVRWIFWTGYSIWFILFSILTFFIALIAGTPG